MIRRFYSHTVPSTLRKAPEFGAWLNKKKTEPRQLTGRALAQYKIQQQINRRLEQARNDNKTTPVSASPRDEQIKSTMITLITEDGQIDGVHRLQQVLNERMDRAQHTLVMVDPQRDPPACRIMSRKLLYDRERTARKQKTTKPTKPQTIQMGAQIGDHDLQVKVQKIQNMLQKGKRVMVVVDSKKRNKKEQLKRQEVGSKVLELVEGYARPHGMPSVDPYLSWSVALHGK